MRWLIGKILSSYFQTEAISVASVHNANSFINGEKILKISLASLSRATGMSSEAPARYISRMCNGKNCFNEKH